MTRLLIDGPPAAGPSGAAMLALALLATLAGGCFDPNLGPAPFRCGADQSCPEGYQCVSVDPINPMDPPTSICQLATLTDGGVPSDGIIVVDTGGGDTASSCQPNDYACQTCERVLILPQPYTDQPSYITLDGVTSGMGGFAGSCPSMAGGDAEGPEVVYLLQLPVPARVEANTRGSSFDTMLYLRASCQIGAGDLSCNDDVSTSGPTPEVQSQISVELQQPGEYYIFVDGFNRLESGMYVLNLQVTPLTQTP